MTSRHIGLTFNEGLRRFAAAVYLALVVPALLLIALYGVARLLL